MIVTASVAPGSKIAPVLRDVPIVGNSYRTESEKGVYASLRVDQEVDLSLETTNEHDPYAVKVLFADLHMGYIPRESCASLHVAAALGYRYTAKVTKLGKFVHISVWIIIP